jgi:hypothetical protein
MNRKAARRLYETAVAYVSTKHAGELQWLRDISPATFAKLDFSGFLSEYCWVVYASGFREAVVKKHFKRLTAAYCNFNPVRLCRKRSLTAVFAVNANSRKARGFVRGARQIRKEGFGDFKARVKKDGMDVLRELPFIGPVTQKHLARNIGLNDVSKDDVWLVRIAQKVGASSVPDLTQYLANATGKRQGVVDLVLWRYCADYGSRVLKGLA